MMTSFLQNTRYIDVDISSHTETVLDISRIVSRNGRSIRGPLHPPPLIHRPWSFPQVENRLFFSLVPSISLLATCTPVTPHPGPLIHPIKGTKYRSVSQRAARGGNPFFSKLSERPLSPTSVSRWCEKNLSGYFFFACFLRKWKSMGISFWGWIMDASMKKLFFTL